jgi:hypothetical protein
MLTITTTTILLTLIGWICRYINFKKGKYKFNIFEEDPNFKSVLLLLGTSYTIITLIFLIIKYLP